MVFFEGKFNGGKDIRSEGFKIVSVGEGGVIKCLNLIFCFKYSCINFAGNGFRINKRSII
jgi:hypothetical protein